MIIALPVALVELFSQGVALAVNIYLMWKRQKNGWS